MSEVDAIFEFSELSERAKEKAREAFRNSDGYLNHDWWDCIYEDAKTCGEILGIGIKTKRVNSSGIAIYFSGFSTQGSGASFDGYYAPAEDAVAKIKEHAPQNTALHALAERLVAVQMTAWLGFGGRYEAWITSHHQHFNVNVEVKWSTADDYEDADASAEKEITAVMNNFASWIYKQLEQEYDYLMSDECVDQYLNDMKFDIEGDEV